MPSMPGVHGMIGGNGGPGMEMEQQQQQQHEHDMSQQQHHGTTAIPTQHTNTLLQQEHLTQQGSTLFYFLIF